MNPRPMLCGYCGEIRVYPDDFPRTHFARCAQCYTTAEEARSDMIATVFVGLCILGPLAAFALLALAMR